MIRTFCYLCSLLAVCVLCNASLAAADADKPAPSYTTEGTFIWSRNNASEPVKAVFTKTEAADTYDVKFYFKWSKKEHIYSGTATGQLKDGKLEGTVKADDQNRSFGFTGTCKDATFSGSHHEKSGAKEQATGTITWKSTGK
jgi:hypothetical protein